MRKIRWILLIAVIILALVVVMQNNHETEVHLLLHRRSLPLSVLMFSTTATGFLLGALLTATMLRRGRAAGKKGKNTAPRPTPSKEGMHESKESRQPG
jgi:uncharacterized integral membrane protein